MDKKMNFKYFYGTEADQFSFYRIPKALFTNECFKDLSSDAKILYGLMLDRMSLSIKNQWFDEENRAYIYFSIEDIMELLNCGRNKAVKSLQELDDEKGIGLVEKRRQGFGKVTIIYVKSFIQEGCEEEKKEKSKMVKFTNQTSVEEEEIEEVYISNFKKSQKQTSRSPENKLQEVYISNSNNTNINNTMNAIYSIFNDDPPADYKAHSLSVSDVVIMNQNGDMKAYFVDRFGFQELPDFVEERKKILGMENDIQKKDILEQTSCISFYAAECSEFPILGEVHHDLTLPEALEAYEKIPAERMNGLKSVGFNLQEGSDYDGMMDLMVAGRSQREILDSIPFYRENKLVQEALKRVEQYIDKKPLNVEKTRPKEEKGEIQKTKSQKRREDMSL